MDPQTGEYENVARTEEEDEYGVDIEGDVSAKEETDKEILKQFARTIGLDDDDAADSLFHSMRFVLLIFHRFHYVR